jgi:hypothetical protein
MADGNRTKDHKAFDAERRRARSRARHARLLAADPDYHKKKYRKWIQLNPNGNREKYKRALEKDPDFNKKKSDRAKEKKIAAGLYTEKPKRKYATKQERERDKYQRSKQATIERIVRRQRERYATDSEYGLYQRLRSRMRYAVKAQASRRSSRTLDLVGCSSKQLAAHIQSQFVDGMNWSNRSQWHIDHIIPVSVFDLTTKEGQQAAFHYTNLRPLWADENRRKSAKPPTPQHMFTFGYVVLADKKKNPGTEGRLGTERRRA